MRNFLSNRRGNGSLRSSQRSNRKAKQQRPARHRKLAFAALEERSLLAGDIQGAIFHDLNGNGMNDAEPAYAGLTVYLDQNQNGIADGGELSAITNASGQYNFTAVPAGRYSVLQPSGFVQTVAGATFGVGVQGQAVDAVGGQGLDPIGVAWANGSLFQVDRGTGSSDPNTVYQINPANGAVLNSFIAPGETTRLAFDGVDLWGTDITNNLIYRFSTTGGVPLQQFASPASGTNTVAWDGANLWVGSTSTDLIYKLNSSGLQIASIPAPDANLQGLAFDGQYLWASGATDPKSIYQISTATGQVLRSFASQTSDIGPGPAHNVASDLTFDGHYLWSIDRSTHTMVRLDPGVPESRTVTVVGEATVIVPEFGVFQTATVSGQVFSDVANLGVKDVGEGGLEGWQAYLDLDGNGNREPWEPGTLTPPSGNYTLSGLRPGSHTLSEVHRRPGFSQTAPAGGSYALNVTSSTPITGQNFGNNLPVGQVGPVGTEARVNATIPGSQSIPTNYASASVSFVGMDALGNYVVAWQGNGPGDPDGIFARRFTATGGDPLANPGEFRVNTTTTGSQINPMVAMADDGKFVVAWTQPGAVGPVSARLYNADGSPLTGEFIVAKAPAFVHSVAMDDDGDFVIVFKSGQPANRAYNFRRYNYLGQSQGNAVKILNDNGDTSASVAMDAVGNFAVAVWTTGGVVAQRYTRLGQKQGPLITVNTTGYGPGIAMDAVGNFVVGWNAGGAGGPNHVVAQRYSASGATVGGLITSDLLGSAYFRPSLAMQPNGEFIVVGPNVENSRAQRYFATGEAPVDATSFMVNTTTAGSQQAGSVAVNGSGRFVVAWSGKGIGSDPADVSNVFVQRYEKNAGSPLLAAGGAVEENANSETLTQDALTSVVEEAAARWQVAGLSAEQVELLQSVSFNIADLGGAVLGLAFGSTIWLDDNAAGWGWFVDPTSGDDLEFLLNGDQGEQNHMDLLSAVMHEMGHVLGLEHSEHEDDLMFESLAAGERQATVEQHDVALLSIAAEFESSAARSKRRFTAL